jgi:hypothetical protein
MKQIGSFPHILILQSFQIYQRLSKTGCAIFSKNVSPFLPFGRHVFPGFARKSFETRQMPACHASTEVFANSGNVYAIGGGEISLAVFESFW